MPNANHFRVRGVTRPVKYLFPPVPQVPFPGTSYNNELHPTRRKGGNPNTNTFSQVPRIKTNTIPHDGRGRFPPIKYLFPRYVKYFSPVPRIMTNSIQHEGRGLPPKPNHFRVKGYPQPNAFPPVPQVPFQQYIKYLFTGTSYKHD